MPIERWLQISLEIMRLEELEAPSQSAGPGDVSVLVRRGEAVPRRAIVDIPQKPP